MIQTAIEPRPASPATYDILVVKFGALGDVIRTSYILPGLLETHPNARITWITSPDASGLLRFNPYVHRLVTSVESWPHDHDRDFDLVLSLDDEPEALRVLDGLNIRKLIGACLIDGRPGYTDDAAAWFDMGLISRHGKAEADRRKRLNRREHNQILESMLGIKIERPLFFNSAIVESQSARRFNGSFFTIGLNSGAGKRWPSKTLPMREAVALTRAMAKWKVDGKPCRVLLLGGAGERERNEEIRAGAAPETMAEIIVENSLLVFAAIIRHCDYIITSDSLALHLAISQERPNLSFFAPTSAAEIGAFGKGVKLQSSAPDYCSYSPRADNSTITAEKIQALASEHLGKFNFLSS